MKFFHIKSKPRAFIASSVLVLCLLVFGSGIILKSLKDSPQASNKFLHTNYCGWKIELWQGKTMGSCEPQGSKFKPLMDQIGPCTPSSSAPYNCYEKHTVGEYIIDVHCTYVFLNSDTSKPPWGINCTTYVSHPNNIPPPFPTTPSPKPSDGGTRPSSTPTPRQSPNPTPYVYLILQGPNGEQIPHASVNDAFCENAIRKQGLNFKDGKPLTVQCTYGSTDRGTYTFDSKAANGGKVTPKDATLPPSGTITVSLPVGAVECKSSLSFIATTYAQSESCTIPVPSSSPSPVGINGKVFEIVKSGSKAELKPASQLYVCILFEGSNGLDCLKPAKGRLVKTDNDGFYSAELPSNVKNVTIQAPATTQNNDPRRNLIEWRYEEVYKTVPQPPISVPTKTTSYGWTSSNKASISVTVPQTANMIVGRSCPTIETMPLQRDRTWLYIEDNIYDILCRLWTMSSDGVVSIPWSRGTLSVTLPGQIGCMLTNDPKKEEMACTVTQGLPPQSTFVPLILVNLKDIERSMKSFGGVSGTNTQPWLQWGLSHELCHFIFGHVHLERTSTISEEQLTDECAWYLVKAIHPEWYSSGNKKRWETIFYTDFRVNMPIELRKKAEQEQYYNTYMRPRHNNMLLHVGRVIPR